jgi:hypothetical protein
VQKETKKVTERGKETEIITRSGRDEIKVCMNTNVTHTDSVRSLLQVQLVTKTIQRKRKRKHTID